MVQGDVIFWSRDISEQQVFSHILKLMFRSRHKCEKPEFALTKENVRGNRPFGESHVEATCAS